MKTGRLFALKASKASVRSRLVSKVSYDARSKSSPEGVNQNKSEKLYDTVNLPVSNGRSSAREIACFAARRARGAEKLTISQLLRSISYLKMIRKHRFLQWLLLVATTAPLQSNPVRRHN